MVRRERVLLASVAVALGCLAGCAQPSGSGTPAPTGAVNAAAAKARADLTNCVDKAGLTQLLTASGRDSLYSCLASIVPPAARATFRNCVMSAAVSDQIWTSGGRATFLDVDGPDCVSAALS